MKTLTPTTGYVILLVYGIIMIAVTYFFARWKRYKTMQGFLVAERNVKWWLGGASIAASWIWAPALFISTQMAYEKGLAGIFWFTVPNIIAIALYIFLAPKIRDKLPQGYTLPQWIKYRLHSEKVHKIYLVPYFFYQVMAVTVQLFAGGSLIHALTGIALIPVMIIMAIIVLAYSLISGLESSIVTDFVQLVLIIVGVGVVVPWAIVSAGGWDVVAGGMDGVSGQFGNIFDPTVAFSFGIVTAIGLISGAISDQQYWQRAFAIKRKNLVRSFLFGAVMFGIVPIALSFLGFIAAHGDFASEGVDTSLIGVAVVGNLLPTVGLVLFVIMLLSALFSTLDSGLNAASSLYVTDVACYSQEEREVLRKVDADIELTASEKNVAERVDRKGVRHAKGAMIGITLVGFMVALAALKIPGFGLKHLWWIFNTIAACVVVPTVLSLYWKRLDARGVFWGVLVSFIVGVPLFVYGNVVDSPILIVGASLFIIGVSTMFCLILRRKGEVERG